MPKAHRLRRKRRYEIEIYNGIRAKGAGTQDRIRDRKHKRGGGDNQERKAGCPNPACRGKRVRIKGQERKEGQMMETCILCGCFVHRIKGTYAKDNLEGRSHATEHHFIPERFFGRSQNRRGTQRERIFQQDPWGYEKKTDVFCYECHEELIHNPVLLPEDIARLSEIMKQRNLNEMQKVASREKIAGRIMVFHEVIQVGIETLLKKGGGE